MVDLAKNNSNIFFKIDANGSSKIGFDESQY